LLGQVPEFGFDPLRCVTMSIIAGAEIGHCSIARNLVEERLQFVEQAMEKLAAQYEGVQYVSLYRAFCGLERCHPYENGKLSYRDDDHVNLQGAMQALAGFDISP
jgi:hypothetical protein